MPNRLYLFVDNGLLVNLAFIIANFKLLYVFNLFKPRHKESFYPKAEIRLVLYERFRFFA